MNTYHSSVSGLGGVRVSLRALILHLLGLIAVVVVMLCASSTLAQTSVDSFYPQPGAVAPLAKQPSRAMRRFLEQGLSPELAVERTGGVVVRSPSAGKARLDYLHLSREGRGAGQCNLIDLPTKVWSGLVAPRPTLWTDRLECDVDSALLGRSWTFSDTFEFQSPVRRRTWDGGEFDASPMVQRRNGEPWLTLFWGYRMGLVESQIDWNPARLATLPEFEGWPRYAQRDEEFVLTTLPPSYIEDEVIEYINRIDFPLQPDGQYFYAANDIDKQILSVKRNWLRTGRSFNAGGYVNVCRFYGGARPGGPNTHFFTSDVAECAALKAHPLLQFEGTAFAADAAKPSTILGQLSTCRAGTRPLYRAYNNAYSLNGKNGSESNHRFVTDRADLDAMVRLGWKDEGVAMCVPALPPQF